MPRTKPVHQDPSQTDLIMKDFEKQTAVVIDKLVGEGKMLMKTLLSQIDIAISRHPPEIKAMTLQEILHYEDRTSEEKENHNVSSTSSHYKSFKASSTMKTTAKRGKRSNISDDGYATESTTTHKSRALKNRKVTTPNEVSPRKTRSSTIINKSKLNETNRINKTHTKKKRNTKKLSSVMKSEFKTPCVKPPNDEYSIVTPKIKPNTPVHVLRRPKEGEMVLSMQGSPLLVSARVEEKVANLNVPLNNGNLISFLPNDGLRLSHIPQLDSETLRQLATLKSHIEKVIGVQ